MEPKRLPVEEHDNTVAFQWWGDLRQRFISIGMCGMPAALVCRIAAVAVTPEPYEDLVFWGLTIALVVALIIHMARSPRHTLTVAPGRLTNSDGLSLDLTAIREIEVNNETNHRGNVIGHLVQAWVRDATNSHQLITVARMFTWDQANLVAHQLTRRLELRATSQTPEPLPVIANPAPHTDERDTEELRTASGWNGPIIGEQLSSHAFRLRDHS